MAETAEEALRLATPQLQMMLALRTGAPLTAQLLVEEAEKRELSTEQQDLVDAMARRWVIGDPESSRSQVRDFAATYDVDEVMISPVSASWVGTDPAQSPAREQTLRHLAA